MRLLPCILLAGSCAAHADTILEYSGNTAGCHADFQRVAVQGSALRIDQAPPQQDFSFAYDGAEKTGVVLDRGHKQFFEMEFDDDAIDFQGDVMNATSNMVNKKTQQAQEQIAQASGGRAQFNAGPNGMPQIDPKMMESMMQQSMAQLNKEQRAQMEEAMKNMRQYYAGAEQSEPVTEASGERREVNGVSCAVERVRQAGQLVREDCRAPLDGIGLDAADLKRLQRALGRLLKFSDAVRGNLHIAGVRMQRERPDMQHLLVERRCFERGEPSGAVKMNLRRESVPADWFERPADYARMDMSGAGAAAR